MLPASSRGSGHGLHHAGARRVDPPGGLPERPQPVRRPAGRDRMGVRKGRPLLREPLHGGYGPTWAPVRRGHGYQRYGYRHRSGRHERLRTGNARQVLRRSEGPGSSHEGHQGHQRGERGGSGGPPGCLSEVGSRLGSRLRISTRISTRKPSETRELSEPP